MMKIRVLVVLILVFGVLTEAMHIHPHLIKKLGESEEEEKTDENVKEIDVVDIDDIQNIQQNRFVPVNSALFFKVSAPCENGYERDAFGICRDVW